MPRFKNKYVRTKGFLAEQVRVYECELVCIL